MRKTEWFIAGFIFLAVCAEVIRNWAGFVGGAT